MAQIMGSFEIRLTWRSFGRAWIDGVHKDVEESTLTREGAWGVPIPWAGKPDDAEQAAYDLEITVEPTTAATNVEVQGTLERIRFYAWLACSC